MSSIELFSLPPDKSHNCVWTNSPVFDLVGIIPYLVTPVLFCYVLELFLHLSAYPETQCSIFGITKFSTHQDNLKIILEFC